MCFYNTEEGPSKRMHGVQVQRPWGGEGEGGAELTLLLEEIRSAPPEQTWLMRQMWSTHAAVASELWLLYEGMDHMHDRLYWAGEGEPEDRFPGVAGEEETLE